MSNTDDGSPDVRWWRLSVPNAAQQARYTDQLRLMIDGLNAALQELDRGAAATVTAYPDPDNLEITEFLYRTDTILVAPHDEAAVVAALDLRRTRRTGRRVPRRVPWLRVLPLDPAQRWGADDQDTTTPAQSALAEIGRLAEIGSLQGRNDIAGFDRVIHLTPSSNSGCPATEPIPAAVGPDPGVNPDSSLGTNVKVAVIDSGLPYEQSGPEGALAQVSGQTWPWLEGVSGEPEADPPRGSQEAALRGHYRGHGLFVAGVIRAMAPAAQVTVYSWGRTTYGQIESELAPILDRVLKTRPHIISMSAGTGVGSASVTRDSSPTGGRRAAAATQPSKCLEQFVDRLARSRSRTLLVCAAGNDGNQGPFEPASIVMPHALEPRSKVAVGALKKRGRLAKYSNRGTWVDVYARGSKVVNAYPDGLYAYMESPLKGTSVTFSTGLAQWSGTSFATPLVAGLVAARMSWSKESARRAWESLSRIADANAPYGLPTLRPGDADRPPSPGGGRGGGSGAGGGGGGGEA